MIDKVMTIWINRQEKLCHDYSFVGFLLYPNPVIMKETAENNTEEHVKAIRRLISKLFLDPTLVGQARVEARANLVDTLWKECSDFNLRTKKSILQTCGSLLKGQVHLHMSGTRPIQWIPRNY